VARKLNEVNDRDRKKLRRQSRLVGLGK
jgi:hypothetical protein